MAQIREQALGFIAGHSVAEIGRIGEEVYDEAMADKIWPGTRALAQMHLDDGHEVWLVTATPVEVATVIAAQLGLTGALGTVAESVDGIYTGRLVGEPLHGPAKAVAVEALAADRGYDLSGAPPTPTRPTTSPCSRWWGTPAPSTPTPACATTPGRRAGWSATTATAARRPSSASRPPAPPPSPGPRRSGVPAARRPLIRYRWVVPHVNVGGVS